MFSWLRTRREPRKPATFRPSLEALGERINPTHPHFVSATSAVTGGGALVVNFKEAGLGDNQRVNVTLSGDAHAVYQWFNHGGNNPQGVPFNVDTTFSLSGTFTSDKNGNVTGTFTYNPPSVSEFLSTHHSAGWVPSLSVSYTNVVVTDTTNGVSTAKFNLDQPVVHFTV